MLTHWLVWFSFSWNFTAFPTNNRIDIRKFESHHIIIPTIWSYYTYHHFISFTELNRLAKWWFCLQSCLSLFEMSLLLSESWIVVTWQSKHTTDTIKIHMKEHFKNYFPVRNSIDNNNNQIWKYLVNSNFAVTKIVPTIMTGLKIKKKLKRMDTDRQLGELKNNNRKLFESVQHDTYIVHIH